MQNGSVNHFESRCRNRSDSIWLKKILTLLFCFFANFDKEKVTSGPIFFHNRCIIFCKLREFYFIVNFSYIYPKSWEILVVTNISVYLFVFIPKFLPSWWSIGLSKLFLVEPFFFLKWKSSLSFSWSFSVS